MNGALWNRAEVGDGKELGSIEILGEGGVWKGRFDGPDYNSVN